MEDTGALRRPESWRVLFRSRPLVVFAAAAAIFGFANGPLLQLVAQKLALAHPGYETGLTSAAIIITQLATIPMALLVTRANALGRKPLLIIAFAAVPLRGFLCASSDNPSWLLGVQLLDGVGAGMYDALLPLLLADIMRGTGRYSLARGVLGTIQGIGVQIEGAFLETWLPEVFATLEELARLCHARGGSIGAFIEDKNSGTILLQQALRRQMPARAIDSKLTAMGEDERAISVSGYVHRESVKYTDRAVEKTVICKRRSRNHLLDQVESFRVGDRGSDREDDLLDTFCYGIALALGNNEGF